MEQLNNLRALNNLAEFEYMFNFAHRDSGKREYIGVMQINKDRSVNHICWSTDRAANKIIDSLENKPEDLYFTLNSFYKPQRKEENLRYMNCLFVDLDFYKFNLSKTEVIKEIDLLVKKNEIPKPSMLIDSGRGMYIIWKIKQIPSMAVKLWRFTAKYLCRKLAHLNADFQCTDPGRVLRVPGSINTKCNKQVEIMTCNSIEYDIHDIKKNYLPDLNEIKKSSEKKKKRYKKSNVSYLFNPHTLNLARIKDIEKLCQIRKYEIKNRELTLFLYRNFCEKEYGKDVAIEKTVNLHNKFKNRMTTDKGLITVTNSVSTKFVQNNLNSGYFYKTETIIEMLLITPEEQKQLSCLISRREKKNRDCDRKKQRRRNKNGLLKSEQRKLELALNVIKLINKEPGIKQKDIALKLKVSKSAISKIIKEIEQGTIKGLETSKKIEVDSSVKHGKAIDISAFQESFKKRLLILCEAVSDPPE